MCHHQTKGILVCLCQHRPRHAARHPPHCCVICSFLLEDSRREPQILIHEISTRTSAATSKKEKNPRKTPLPHGSPTRVKIKNQQQHDLHERPRWMHEWSYAALKQLQNPKPFVITVARIPPISFVYIGCIGRPQVHTMSLSSDVAASGVDLRIDCTQ